MSADDAIRHIRGDVPKTTWAPSSQDVTTVVMKNCEPLVFLPALAMERIPGFVCFSWKFSSVEPKNDMISSCTPQRRHAFARRETSLTLELLAVDRLSTGTVTAGEVATLEHEVGDDTVEGRALVAETMLAGGELAEVTSGLWDDVVVELEGDATRGLVVDRDVELRVPPPPSESRCACT